MTASVRPLYAHNRVPPARNTAYTAVYYAWLGLSSGIAPLLAGRILGAWSYGRVRPDDRYRTREVVRIAAQRVWRRSPT